MDKTYNKLTSKAIQFDLIGDNCLIMQGDSTEILRNLVLETPINSVITDPPYEFDSRGGPLYGREKSHFDDIRSADITSGFDLSILSNLAGVADQMLVFMHNDQLYKLLGHLTQPRREVVTGGDGWQEYEDHPAYYNRFIMGQWHKSNPMPVANKHYVPDTELYIHAWRPPAYPQGELKEKGRYIIAPVGKSDFNHPTVKPQKIMKKAVINASSVGDTVFDPFMGSGSTGEAALRLGRAFIGIELDEGFYNMAKKRLKACVGEYGGDLHIDNSRQSSLFEEK